MAFLTTGMAALTYGQLQTAQVVGPLNGGTIWAFMLVSYVLAYAVAARQYRKPNGKIGYDTMEPSRRTCAPLSHF